MKLNEHLRSARLRLGLSEQTLAERSELTIYELGDVEARPDELLTTITSQAALRLCRELGVDVCDLLGLGSTSDLSQEELKAYLHRIRKASGLTSVELDDLIGYEEGFVQKLEDGSVDLAEYPLQLAMDIADETKSSRATMIGLLAQWVRRT